VESLRYISPSFCLSVIYELLAPERAVTASSGLVEKLRVASACARAVGAMKQAPALSSKCGQRHVDNRRRRLNTDLLYLREWALIQRFYRCF